MTETATYKRASDTLLTNQTISRGKYTMCPICHNVKYKKQWHAQDSKVAFLASGRKAHSGVRRCPACEMQREGRYAAVVVIHDVPKTLRYRVASSLKNEAENAVYRNPQNRVLEMLETLDGYEVRTTSTKLARTISAQIKDQFQAREVVSSLTKKLSRETASDVILKISEYL